MSRPHSTDDRGLEYRQQYTAAVRQLWALGLTCRDIGDALALHPRAVAALLTTPPPAKVAGNDE